MDGREDHAGGDGVDHLFGLDRYEAECGILTLDEAGVAGMTRVTTDKVPKELLGSLQRVVDDGERVVVDRSGKSVAAIVPMEDLELLRRIEDMLDCDAAIEAREEPGRVPWPMLKKELDL